MKLISLLFLLLLLASCNKPKYKRGECFLLKDQVINEEPKEYWHKPFKKGDVEYLVLKVGKQFYQVASSEKGIKDVPITIQSNSIKSNCSLIYKK